MSTEGSARKAKVRTRIPWGILGAHGAAWICAAALEHYVEGEVDAAIIVLGSLSLAILWFGYRVTEEKRWVRPLQSLADSMRRLKEDPEERLDSNENPELSDISRALRDLQRRMILANRQGGRRTPPPYLAPDSGEFSAKAMPSLSRSGLLASPFANSGETNLIGVDEHDIVARLDPQTYRWLASSEAEQRFLGWTFESLSQKSYSDILLPADREAAMHVMGVAVKAGEAHGLRWRVVDASGTAHPVTVSLSMRYDAEGNPRYIKLNTTDETERIREDDERRRREFELAGLNEQLVAINAELRELTKTNEELYENAPVMYFSLDRRLCFVDCNRTMLTTLGVDRKQIIGKYYTSLLASGEASIAKTFFKELGETGKSETETTWRKADGGEITVWIASNVVYRRDGSFGYARAVAMDVTERRGLQEELREKNKTLELTIEELSRKNKELDDFSHVVSHDLLEPVRSLIAFSEYLQADFGPKLDDNGREYLQYLVEAAKRQRALIRDLLALSRAGRVVTKFQAVDLNEVMRVVQADLAGLIRDRHAEVRLDGEFPALWGDRGRIQQLLSNLTANGIKYNRSEHPTVRLEAEALPNGMVRIRVTDNGIGIPEHAQARAFQLFRQLHPRGEFEGTGAGLAICRKIAQSHGGEIIIERSVEGPGGGTTFALTLPALSFDNTDVTEG